jgi:hypothetical protein
MNIGAPIKGRDSVSRENGGRRLFEKKGGLSMLIAAHDQRRLHAPSCHEAK